MRSLFIKLVFFFISTQTLAVVKVDLSKGLMSIGGDFTANYQYINKEGRKNIWSLNSSSAFSYFLMDNLSVSLGLPITWGINPNSYAEIGLKGGADYYMINTSIFVPYVGIQITPKMRLARNDNEFLFSSGINLGTLVSLTKKIALDLGIRPEVSFRLSERQYWSIDIPIGFIGIRAFFSEF